MTMTGTIKPLAQGLQCKHVGEMHHYVKCEKFLFVNCFCVIVLYNTVQ